MSGAHIRGRGGAPLGWAVDHAEYARRRWGEGGTAGQIRDELNAMVGEARYTRNAVIGKLNRMEAPRRGPKAAATARAAELKRRAANRPAPSPKRREPPPPASRVWASVERAPPVATPPTPPPPAEPIVTGIHQPVLFEQRPANRCAWPLWDTWFEAGVSACCGAPVAAEGKPYCTHHARASRAARQPARTT